MRVSMNVGLTASQLRQLTQILADRVDADHARRACEALERHWPPNPEAEVSASGEL